MAVRPRYVRHRSYERVRHSTYFKKWLSAQAERLQITEEEVFEALKAGGTFETIEGLPEPEPDPEPDPEQ